jgi:hypothetical protein
MKDVLVKVEKLIAGARGRYYFNFASEDLKV